MGVTNYLLTGMILQVQAINGVISYMQPYKWPRNDESIMGLPRGAPCAVFLENRDPSKIGRFLLKRTSSMRFDGS